MISPFAIWTTAIVVMSAGDPGADAARGDVTGLQILPSAQHAEVVIMVDGAIGTRDFTMEGPHRIVIDLMDSQFSLPQESYEDLGIGGIRTVRASQYSDEIVRVVIELLEPAEYVLQSGDGYVRVSLENPWGSFEPWASEALVLPVAAQTPVPEASAARDVGPTPRWSGIASQQFADRISVAFTNTPILEVLFHFAEFSNRSIVPGSDVTGNVSVDIRDQPWDIALQAVLESQGLAAQELASGIIRVDRLEDLLSREEVEQLVTRPFRISYANAQDLSTSVETLLSERGRVSVNPSTNQLVVTDIPRVLESVEQLVNALDLRTPQVTISAKIIFVNRTDLQEFGVTYDLKDSQGNQLNQLTPGGIDRDGDGRISAEEEDNEIVPIGTDVVSLGGSSLAALGNANTRVTGPALRLLTSLVMGRHTLISFVEALESVNLSDVQAAPQTTVLDNREARILVGERTPIRVIDNAAGGAGGQQGGQQFPQATVEIVETGIILEVTPHVTAGDLIWMDLRAERSGVEIREADIGFVFNTQLAETQVLVANGETVVIGGLTVTERTEVRAGIPLLQDLPLLGRFFRLTREQVVQRDLMILVTPQINRR
ncbi:MAG: secretin N-terminal domain-containing protein [Gemmatimonadota bacterium]